MEKSNVEADALSQIPRNGYHEVKSLVVKAILKSLQEIDWTDFNGDLSDIICKSSQTISEKMTTEQWKIEQVNDEIIKQVMEALKAGSDKYTFSLEPAKQMFRFRSKLIFRHGLLYKKYFDINLHEERMQFVLPKKYWPQALKACHDNVGHLGIERALLLL